MPLSTTLRRFKICNGVMDNNNKETCGCLLLFAAWVLLGLLSISRLAGAQASAVFFTGSGILFILWLLWYRSLWYRSFRKEREVASAATSLRRSGDKRGYEKMREYVLMRDGRRCQKCGSPNDLEVHHLIRRSAGGPDSPLNLTTLCRHCHDSQHPGAREYYVRKYRREKGGWFFL